MDVEADVATEFAGCCKDGTSAKLPLGWGVSGQSLKDENVCYVAVGKNIYLLHHPMQSRVHP